MENWIDIPGWGAAYQVSDLGNIRSVDRIVPGSKPCQPFRFMRGQIIKKQLNRNGYHLVRLSLPGGKVRTVYVHHLVLEGFVGPRPKISERSEIRHLNGEKTDCRLVNLVYGTSKENSDDYWSAKRAAR